MDATLIVIVVDAAVLEVMTLEYCKPRWKKTEIIGIVSAGDDDFDLLSYSNFRRYLKPIILTKVVTAFLSTILPSLVATLVVLTEIFTHNDNKKQSKSNHSRKQKLTGPATCWSTVL